MSQSQLQSAPESRESSRSTLGDEPLSGVAREALELPPGPVGAVLMARVQNYLKKTGVQEEFFSLIRKLLSRDELPYNPYPGLAVRLRPFMERFYTLEDTDDKVENALSVPLRQTKILDLFTAQEGLPLWGLRSILRVVNTSMINRYRWLSENITPSYNDLFQKDGYSNQVMVALVGAAIFHGSFYRQVHISQYRLEFLITGRHADEAVSIFVNSVMMDVDRIIQSPYHILIGLNVPVLGSVSENVENWLLEFWDPQTIQSYKGELMQKMCDAVLGNKYIIAECVFQLDPMSPSFIQGQKQYTLNFVEVVDELKEEGLSNFAEYPMASLHEGLFFNQTHAEAYISMFTPQFDIVDNANVQKASARPVKRQGGNTGRQSAEVVEDDYHYIHRHVHQRLQHHKPRKARIDGFRLGLDPGSGPFAWQITSPIKSNLQKRIVGFNPWAELFDIAYHMILLVLMDRKTSDTPLLMELYRLCHSTAGKLHMLGEKNKAVRALIRGFLNRDDGYRVRQFLLEYKTDIDELLASSLHERSSDLVCVGKAMSTKILEVLEVSDEELRSSSYLNLIVVVLRDQHSFMVTTLMRLAEDVLTWSPKFKHQVEQLHKNFPNSIPKPAANVRDPEAAGWRDRIPRSVYVKHGFEDDHIMKHDGSTILVASNMKQEAPQVISKEIVLMKYVIDTHLDETWETFLETSFQRPQLPPNPYPSLITKCRACAMRMDLCYEPESTILDRLLTKMAKAVDPDNYVYQLPSCDACGPATAMAVLDPGSYIVLVQTVDDYLVNKAYIHRKGPYRIGICLGITGPAALYGKMRPYLTQLDLHEHYYIQGPTGCETDAAQLFAVMIQKHIWELVSANKVPILGVFVGIDKIRWKWEEIINKKLGFFTEVETTVLRKEPIYLKTLVLTDGWRYVPVVKQFMLHYMTDDGLGSEIFFQDDPTYFYATLFSSSERAAFHYQNGGPLRGGNPVSSSNMHAALAFMNSKILRLYEESNFMEVYRHLLLRSLIADNTEYVVEAWRMFHSIAGQAEYVASLAQALAEVVEFEIEYAKFSSVEVSQSGKSDSEVKTNPSPVNLGVVSAMTSALMEKAETVSRSRISMSALELPQFLTLKLKSIVETDSKTGKVYPIFEESTVSGLEEIQNMFIAIKTTTSNDVHITCDNAHRTFEEIHRLEGTRPLSVDSQILNDPQVFQQRPRAGHRILDDELLYKPKRQQMFKPHVNY